MDDIRNYVKEKYAKAVKNAQGCCGADKCCCGTSGTPDILSMTKSNYGGNILEKTPGKMTDQSFGCGNPVTEANIHYGETVLDLGSGAGLDLFLSSDATGPYGRVIGLDMTDEMLETAAENLKDLKNVTLVKGYIEEMPLESDSVDVIISNCVINLSPDKEKVLKEAFRVLRPGGRFCVSDTVFLYPISKRASRNLAAWSGCISGALLEEEYATKMKDAGFENVEVRRKKVYAVPDALAAMAFPELDTGERDKINGALASAIILGKKPLLAPEEGKDFTVRSASPEDIPAICALLEENGLTSLGVAETPKNYMVLEHSGIIAVVGMEVVNGGGLLRSLAVQASHRKKKFGERMVRAALENAVKRGVKMAYLLTETAENFFKTFGFSPAVREDIPPDLLQSSTLERVCATGSIAMKKELSDKEK